MVSVWMDVWCCGEVLQGAIPLVFRPLTYINASEKLLKRITDPTVSTDENKYNLAAAGSVESFVSVWKMSISVGEPAYLGS